MPNPRAFIQPKPEKTSLWDTRVPEPPAKKCRCDANFPPIPSIPSVNSSEISTIDVPWFVGDIAKAAKLLVIPPINVNFDNEHEMRRVYSLIYDVFRYKNVLNKALSDTNFFFVYPEYTDHLHVVWLLLFDLHWRRYRERTHVRPECKAEWCQCASQVPLDSVENALWQLRIKLAASVSRLRIARNALRLTDMLPSHLRDDRLVQATTRKPLTAWVNKFRVASPVEMVEELSAPPLEFISLPQGQPLRAGRYCWDALCPMFICFHHSERNLLSQSDAVKQYRLVVQDRSFAYGPAMFCKLLYEMEICGSVIMTHVTSPRATAYLASLLSQNEKIFSLLAFGAGERKAEFEDYMTRMAVDNVLVYSRRWLDADMDADVLENVVAVFATPPNSYSAVADPIDLVCGRGGDMMMLEVLTDTENSEEGQQRVTAMLNEQLLTLKLAMSRPQIQFVLYETHSQLESENQDMVTHALEDHNYAVKKQHAGVQSKQMPSYATAEELSMEINNNEPEKSLDCSQPSEAEISDRTDSSQPEKESCEFDPNLKIPETDEFEQGKLRDLCFNSDSCLKLKKEGCFLAILQRKEVMNLDSKYMIKMAESRGLFAAADSENVAKKQKTGKKVRKKTASTKQKNKKPFEIERISAQTHASRMRCVESVICSENMTPCRKFKDATTPNSVILASPAKQWWAETTRYLTNLKKSLIRHNLVQDRPAVLRKLLKDNNKVLQDINNIDEILNKMPKIEGTTAKIPPFPKLRLSRPTVPPTRIPFPLYNCSVELPKAYY